jgi:flagellar hook-basal body complex protein FliE
MSLIVTAPIGGIAAAGAEASKYQDANVGGSFSKMMSGALSDAASALKTAEATSAQAMEGKASIQQVVDTVMDAERQLQTILTIRDKVVAAYQEISRTSI